MKPSSGEMEASWSKKLEPTDIALDLTYRCNRSCGFCFLDCTDLKSYKRKELTAGEINIFVDSLGALKRQFFIAGGEPLLRRDFLKIISHIKKRSHRCLITTNGTLLDEKTCLALLKMKVDEIVISIHGDRDTHDRVVGRKGSFELLEKAAGFINASKYKTATLLTFWCTINGLNHKRLLNTYVALKKLGPDNVAFNHLDYITPADRAATAGIFSRELSCPLLPRSSSAKTRFIDTKKLAAQISKVKAADADEQGGVKFSPDLHTRQLSAWYDGKVFFKKPGVCRAQWNQLWVSPWGDVLSCVPLMHTLGNIRQRPWREIYNGAEFSAFREALLKAGGLFPICSRCGRESYYKANIDIAQDKLSGLPRPRF